MEELQSHSEYAPPANIGLSVTSKKYQLPDGVMLSSHDFEICMREGGQYSIFNIRLAACNSKKFINI